jgi:hypothetical protein
MSEGQEIGGWIVSKYKYEGHHIFAVEEPNGRTIVEIKSKYDMDRDEKIANLFRVAPEIAAERDRLRETNAELLAALEKLSDVSRSYIGAMDDEDLESLKHALAAIAKATGEAK